MSEIGFIDDNPFEKNDAEDNDAEGDDVEGDDAEETDGDDAEGAEDTESDDSEDTEDDMTDTDDEDAEGAEGEIEITQIQINESDLANRIPDTERRSYNLLTKFEKIRVITTRAEQIARGSPSTIQTKLIDPIEIAEEELKQNKIPIIIRRPIMIGMEKKYEEWNVKDLI